MRNVRDIVKKYSGTRTLYSDKIKNGRSVKVSGFTVEDYSEAVKELEAEGYKVKITSRENVGWGGYSETSVRLLCTVA